MLGVLAAVALGTALHGPAGYYYATAFDSGNTSGHPGESISAQILTETQATPDPSDHSLTEIWVEDKAGNAAEVGIMTDPAFWGTPNPVLFITSWTAGKFNGYSSAENGYVNTSGVNPGFATQPKVGAWTEYGFNFSGGQLNVSYNGKTIGHYAPAFWAGGWKGTTESQTYGEAYNQSSAEALPDMNGAVRDFSAGGNTFTYDGTGVSAPYSIVKGKTSFSFSG